MTEPKENQKFTAEDAVKLIVGLVSVGIGIYLIISANG
jgi:hypothetical protein